MNYVKSLICICLLLVIPALGMAADTESVVDVDILHGDHGYECNVEVQTNRGAKMVFRVSGYKSVWKFSAWLSNRKRAYRKFFKKVNGVVLQQSALLSAAYTEFEIGGQKFPIHEVFLGELLIYEVNEDSFAEFSIVERHNVAAVLNAMSSGTFEIDGLVRVEGLEKAYGEIRRCGYHAMGIMPDEVVEIDQRAESRLTFERHFEAWVQAATTKGICIWEPIGERAIAKVIERASRTFYPGWRQGSQRKDFVRDMERIAGLAQLNGVRAAEQRQCLDQRDKEQAAWQRIDEAMTRASEVD